MLEKIKSDVLPVIYSKAFTKSKVLLTVNVGCKTTEEGFEYNSFTFRKESDMTFGEILDAIHDSGVFEECTAEELRALADGVGTDELSALEHIKRVKLDLIDKYDSSDNVNIFLFEGMPFWIDKATRVGLMNSTTILKAAGYAETTLWFGGMNLVIPCDNAIGMLSLIEMYALQCYNVTAMHKADMNRLGTIDEVVAFDFKSGYPEKLTF